MDFDAELLNINQCRILESLRVKVSAVLGEIEVNAKELLDISAGQSFSFSIDDQAKLKLCALGEVIGSARLVREDGKLFIEVLETTDTDAK